MAGLAMHPSAEPDTLVVRVDDEEREWLIEDAPETYYLTDYYRKYPLVLVRLSRIDRDALRDVLSVSWRLTPAKGAQASQAVFASSYPMISLSPNLLNLLFVFVFVFIARRSSRSLFQSSRKSRR